MARATTNSQLFLNDGTGKHIAVATSTWKTKAIDMSETRRLSVTAAFQGGFTGTLVVEGTDEPGECSVGGVGNVSIPTGNAVDIAGAGVQPGKNGVSGALYWTPVQSGTVSVTNSTQLVQIGMNDVNHRWIRITFNKGLGLAAVGSAVGSGVQLFITCKNT